MLLESHPLGCGFQLYASSWDLRFLDMGCGLEVRTLFLFQPGMSHFMILDAHKNLLDTKIISTATKNMSSLGWIEWTTRCQT